MREEVIIGMKIIKLVSDFYFQWKKIEKKSKKKECKND